MGTHAGSVMTLANSIIGVSVLAMPFCFKQCGIVLSIVMLLASSIVSRLACHYLIKAAIMEKRRNFEMLAFRVFGPTGKLMVELCIIGFMVGTCVAYFVVVGDLGPAIMAPILGFEHPTALRPSVLIALGVFVVLPLGLLRNVDSLSTLSAASIAFYSCLVLKVLGEATTHLLAWDWVDKVYYWRPSGFLQCIPIFSMALSCQTQLFEIFDSLPNTPLDRMNSVVKSAINMTTLFYIAVGFFGYIAYCNQSFTGNLMMNFSPTITSDVIKIGFVLSVAVSFPLVIFPCRASLYSLLFSKGHTQPHEFTGSAHIPERKFQCITLVIVTGSLITGLLIPNIELVLGLVGSTIGVFICIVFPAVIFISLSTRNTNERLLAKILVGAGLTIMVLGTYTNLHATSKAVSGPEVSQKSSHSQEQSPPIELQLEHDAQSIALPAFKEKVVIRDETLKELKDVKELAALPQLRKENLAAIKPVMKVVAAASAEGVAVQAQGNARQEPPVPIDPEAKNIQIIADVKSSADQDIKAGGAKQTKSDLLQDTAQLKTDDNNAIDAKHAQLLEKLIEHEVIHKKFIDEGKKLLSQIEQTRKKGDDSRDKVGENQLAATVKLVNVKTGVVSNLVNKSDLASAVSEIVVKSGNVNEQAKIDVDKSIGQPDTAPVKKNDVVPVEESQMVGNKQTADDGFDKQMLKNMAKGIPLPVANKATHLSRTNSSRPQSSRDAVAAPELPKREILQEDKIEERGKRDLEEVEKLDGRLEQDSVTKSAGGTPSPAPDIQNSLVEEHNAHVKTGAPVIVNLSGGKNTEPDSNGSSKELAVQNEPKVEYPENPERSFSEMLLDEAVEKEKECVKDDKVTAINKSSENVVASKMNNVSSEQAVQNPTEDLIRTPSYLSEQKPVFEGPVKIDTLDSNVLQESGRPLKRDLKSVEPLNNSPDDTQSTNGYK